MDYEYNLSEIEETVRSIVDKLGNKRVITLQGDLGSGKTAFTRELVRQLGFMDRVQSPTFVILRKYNKMGKDNKHGITKINHFDLYRLNDKSELFDLGIEELIMEPKCLTLIEWPELLEELLPKEKISIEFEYINEDTRKIKINN